MQELKVTPAAIVVSVGGGGLLLGIMEGLKKVGWQDHVRVIAVETEGSASLARSLKVGFLFVLLRLRFGIRSYLSHHRDALGTAKEGRSITLDGINTIAKSLGS